MTNNNLEKLRSRLTSMLPGELAGEEAYRVTVDLAEAWDDLSGSEEGGMDGHKFNRGIAELKWDPPDLGFQIERHGSNVQGSTRADLQRWNVDVDKGTARLVSIGWRQLQPMDARLDVKRLAFETASMIVDGRQSPHLEWVSKDSVRVQTSIVIPTTNKQTTNARRKRFVTELKRLLDPQGWCRVAAGSYTLFQKRPES